MASTLRVPVAFSLLAMCTLAWGLPVQARPVSSTRLRGVIFTFALDKSVYDSGRTDPVHPDAPQHGLGGSGD